MGYVHEDAFGIEFTWSTDDIDTGAGGSTSSAPSGGGGGVVHVETVSAQPIGYLTEQLWRRQFTPFNARVESPGFVAAARDILYFMRHRAVSSSLARQQARYFVDKIETPTAAAGARKVALAAFFGAVIDEFWGKTVAPPPAPGTSLTVPGGATVTGVRPIRNFDVAPVGPSHVYNPWGGSAKASGETVVGGAGPSSGRAGGQVFVDVPAPPAATSAWLVPAACLLVAGGLWYAFR